MRINDLLDINWDELPISDLVRANDLMGMYFEVNNGKITRVFIDRRSLNNDSVYKWWDIGSTGL